MTKLYIMLTFEEYFGWNTSDSLVLLRSADLQSIARPCFIMVIPWSISLFKRPSSRSTPRCCTDCSMFVNCLRSVAASECFPNSCHNKHSWRCHFEMGKDVANDLKLRRCLSFCALSKLLREVIFAILWRFLSDDLTTKMLVPEFPDRTAKLQMLSTTWIM